MWLQWHSVCPSDYSSITHWSVRDVVFHVPEWVHVKLKCPLKVRASPLCYYMWLQYRASKLIGLGFLASKASYSKGDGAVSQRSGFFEIISSIQYFTDSMLCFSFTPGSFWLSIYNSIAWVLDWNWHNSIYDRGVIICQYLQWPYCNYIPNFRCSCTDVI